MCIVFITTSHPKYSLILIDNRDEYILRPTSRPQWWKDHSTGNEILCSRDLHRPEKGTWLGVTKTGLIAVLTNYREQVDDVAHPVQGRRSRGLMVTAWLGESPKTTVKHSVEHFVHDVGVKGVGGFSIVCGKLRKNSEGFAIVSNRADSHDDVPIVTPDNIMGWGLSNTTYDKSDTWPKVAMGSVNFNKVIERHATEEESEEKLISLLFEHLGTNTLTGYYERSLEENIQLLKNSIFVPAIGDEKQKREMETARARGKGNWPTGENLEKTELGANGISGGTFDIGMYGTQRQTVVLVDREGNVTYVERALWDSNGNEVSRGEGDVRFKFKVEGWEEK